MRLFEFRDPTPIEAFVLAADYDRAAEIFERHLQAQGGDPDTLLWREWPPHDVGPAERPAISDALAIGREGLVSCDAAGRWVFVTPVGDGKKA